MIYLAAGLVVFCFAGVLKVSGVQDIGSSAIGSSRRAARAMRDGSLTDHEKEHAMRQASGALMESFLSIAWRSAVAVGVALVVLWIADAAGFADSSFVTRLLMTWRGIAIALLATAVVYLMPLKRRVRPGLTQTS